MKLLKPYSKKNWHTTQLERGFTVLEMIVVISIISLFAGVLIFNHQTFKAHTDFSVFLQEVALTIKKQQLDAMSGKIADFDLTYQTFPTNWKPSYGIYIYQNNMVLFADLNGDKEYNNGSSGGTQLCDHSFGDECLKILKMSQNRSEVNVYSSYPTYIVGAGGFGDISLVFTRPYPDMIIKTDNPIFSGNGNTTSMDVAYPVEIGFSDPALPDTIGIISVNPTGAISVREVKKAP